MKPPIKVAVSTDNLRTCTLLLTDGDGTQRSIVVPSDGNVYQGLHRVREELEAAFNDMLAAHGILPPEPPPEAETVPSLEVAAPATTTEPPPEPAKEPPAT